MGLDLLELGQERLLLGGHLHQELPRRDDRLLAGLERRLLLLQDLVDVPVAVEPAGQVALDLIFRVADVAVAGSRKSPVSRLSRSASIAFFSLARLAWVVAISRLRYSTSTSARARFSMLSLIAGSRLAICCRARSI